MTARWKTCWTGGAGLTTPAVAELIRLAETGSPTLAKAVARINGARATLASSNADAWPTLTGYGSASRAKSVISQGNTSLTSLTSPRSVGAGASSNRSVRQEPLGA